MNNVRCSSFYGCATIRNADRIRFKIPRSGYSLTLCRESAIMANRVDVQADASDGAILKNFESE